jgi:hypothetical protein
MNAPSLMSIRTDLTGNADDGAEQRLPWVALSVSVRPPAHVTDHGAVAQAAILHSTARSLLPGAGHASAQTARHDHSSSGGTLQFP